MATAIRHDPPPTPPPTFDIVGLTEDEATKLLTLLGATMTIDIDMSLYTDLRNALQIPFSDFHLRANGNGEVVTFLKFQENS